MRCTNSCTYVSVRYHNVYMTLCDALFVGALALFNNPMVPLLMLLRISLPGERTLSAASVGTLEGSYVQMYGPDVSLANVLREESTAAPLPMTWKKDRFLGADSGYADEGVGR